MSRTVSYLPDLPDGEWADGTIYYIMCSKTGRMKIGFTRGNVGKRLKALQTGSPTKLSVVAIHPGTPEVERSLHEKFAADRLHGEWFDISDELVLHCGETYQIIIALCEAMGKEPPEWATAGRQGVQSVCQAILAQLDEMDGETIQ